MLSVKLYIIHIEFFQIVAYFTESTLNKCYNNRTKINLINIIKNKKNLIPNATFTAIFLAAISKSLNNYFLEKNFIIPQYLTVIVPMRIEGKDYKTIYIYFQVEFIDISRCMQN